MESLDFGEWLETRSPSVPPPLKRILMAGRGGAVDFGALTRWSGEALSGALRKPGRVREAAFELLVADALLTYACEMAVREPSAETGLTDILQTLGDRFE